MAKEARETNQAKWVGVRHAHNGEQVMATDMTAATGIRIVYTVPANKKLLLFSVAWSLYRLDALVHLNYAGLFNVVPTCAFRFFYGYSTVREITAGAFNPNCPMELPAGWVIKTYSNSANSRVSISYHGFLIDA